jgi:DNA-binding transcriptional MerR regulator/methylmalonyl-CoA mutase cobalamin-binding subunit
LNPWDDRAMKTVNSRDARYPIRAVSRLTGVSIDTLRAWERRYNAVTPTRDERGRLYSDADVARLRLLNQAVASGHSIGRVAGLSDRELRQQLKTVDVPGVGVSSKVSTGMAHGDFADALARFDTVAVDRELARLAAVLSPADLVRNVMLPGLRKVGDEWNDVRGGIAREHLMSSAMKHLLGSFLRLHARADSAVRLLFATPSGDRHEIGILGAAMLAASRGLGVSYLGADLPAAQILEAVRAAHVSVVVLGLTFPTPSVARELRALVRDLPGDVELWAGGAGTEQYSRLLGTRARILREFDAYLQQLEYLAG